MQQIRKFFDRCACSSSPALIVFQTLRAFFRTIYYQKLKVSGVSVQPALARRPMLNSTHSVQSEVSRILLAHLKPGLGQGFQNIAPRLPDT